MKQATAFKETEGEKESVKWKPHRLSDICEAIFSGGTPNTRTVEYWNGDICWLSSGETRSTFIRGTEKTITRYGVENSSTRLAKKSDVVVASAGQGFTRGQAAILMIDTYINQSVIALRADQTKILPLFLYYSLSSRYDELRRISDGQSSRGSLTTKLLANFEIEVPPITEQERIVRILSNMDYKIELNEQMNATLEDISQALFKRWFVDFDFPDKNGKPYKSSGGKMVESDLGPVPEGWRVDGLKELATVETGKRPTEKSLIKSAEFSVPLIGASSIMGYVSDCLYDMPILVIGRVGTHGVVQRFIGRAYPSDNTLVLKSPYPEYINQVLRTIDYQTLNVGSTQPLITQTAIRNFSTTIPSAEVLKMFESVVGLLSRAVHENVEQTSLLTQLRDLLLPRLMSGKIRLGVIKNVPQSSLSEKSTAANFNPFKEAILMAEVIAECGSSTFPVSRFRYNKLSYFAKRFTNEDTTQFFAQMELGPYNPKTRYKGPEGIAIKNKYIRPSEKGFFTASSIASARSWAKKYQLDGAVQRAKGLFQFAKSDALETLSTVDFCALDLKKQGKLATIESVKEYLANHFVWKDKLKKKSFTDEEINDALKRLSTIFSQDYRVEGVK